MYIYILYLHIYAAPLDSGRRSVGRGGPECEGEKGWGDGEEEEGEEEEEEEEEEKTNHVAVQ